jgi:enterochelin esterase-like enzyme
MTADLLARAHSEGSPLIEGETATFVWQGPSVPRLVGDFNHWGRDQAAVFTSIEPDVWTYSVELPRDAYIEYAYYAPDDERVFDPFNPHTAPTGLAVGYHYFYMPDVKPTPLTRRKRGAPAGKITRHTLKNAYLLVGGRRVVRLYHPPTTEPCPLLVVFDGQDYLRCARLVQIVDNLIAQQRIRPIALALLDHGKQARVVEYAANESTVNVVLDEVLPLAAANLNLLDVHAQPGAYGLLGASMGGLISMYAALRAPEIFGKVLCQSGAFSLNEHDTVVFDLVRAGAARSIRVWQDIGHYEQLLPVNQHLAQLLRAQGCDVTYHEYQGGHSYMAWRDDVWRGLEAMFGPASG